MTRSGTAPPIGSLARRLAAACVVSILIGGMRPCAASDWLVQADAIGGFPGAPAEFRDSARSGLGLAGSVSRVLAQRFEIGLAGEFLQFRRGKFSTVVGDSAYLDVTGGARRYSVLCLPVRCVAWQHPGFHRSRLRLEASVGYAHESTDGISGLLRPIPPRRADGVAYEVGASLSRLLYRRTRWLVGLHYADARFQGRSAQYWKLSLGAHMPLDGSRPQAPR